MGAHGLVNDLVSLPSIADNEVSSNSNEVRTRDSIVKSPNYLDMYGAAVSMVVQKKLPSTTFPSD